MYTQDDVITYCIVTIIAMLVTAWAIFSTYWMARGHQRRKTEQLRNDWARKMSDDLTEGGFVFGEMDYIDGNALFLYYGHRFEKLYLDYDYDDSLMVIWCNSRKRYILSINKLELFRKALHDAGDHVVDAITPYRKERELV